jgi:thiamine transporter
MVNKTQRLTVSGIMIALGTVLSFITIFRLPYGGSITLFSMVPILLLGYLFGIKWGIACGAVFGVIQGLLGATMSAAFVGQTVGTVLAVMMIDYIIAFTVLGLAGTFKHKIKKTTVAFPMGCVLAIFLRFCAHFVSGVLIWGSYAQSTLEGIDASWSTTILSNFTGTGLAAMYSLVYNASYMLPEMVISLIAAVIIISVKPVRRLAE